MKYPAVPIPFVTGYVDKSALADISADWIVTDPNALINVRRFAGIVTDAANDLPQLVRDIEHQLAPAALGPRLRPNDGGDDEANSMRIERHDLMIYAWLRLRKRPGKNPDLFHFG